MGCKNCGGGRKRFYEGIPMLDKNGKQIAENYASARHLPKKRPKRIRAIKPPAKANINKNKYPNLVKIEFTGKRINVLDYDGGKCIYIVGYMDGCGSCNYMRRLLNKIMTPELQSKMTTYILDKSIVEPKGFKFSGNPTILIIDQGKLVFQVGGIYNNIESKIVQYLLK